MHTLPSAARAALGRFARRVRKHFSTGARGERRAARHLRRAGWRVLARGWRTPLAEIDLLCEAGRGAGSHDIVLVEVKTRRDARGLDPLLRLRAAQRRRLEAAVRWVAARTPRDRAVRLDVVIVTLARGGPPPRHVPILFRSAGRALGPRGAGQ